MIVYQHDYSKNLLKFSNKEDKILLEFVVIQNKRLF